jgi:hypothetical protein
MIDATGLDDHLRHLELSQRILIDKQHQQTLMANVQI